MSSVEQQLAEALAEVARLKEQCLSLSQSNEGGNSVTSELEQHSQANTDRGAYWLLDCLLTVAVLGGVAFAAHRLREWHTGPSDTFS